MTDTEKLPVCPRCKGTGYHGPWGDSTSDDDTPRRCNYCDFHRGPKRERKIGQAKDLLTAAGYVVVSALDAAALKALDEVPHHQLNAWLENRHKDVRLLARAELDRRSIPTNNLREEESVEVPGLTEVELAELNLEELREKYRVLQEFTRTRR